MNVEANSRPRTRDHNAGGGLLALGAGLLLLSLLAAAPPQAVAAEDCRLTFGPTPVMAGGEVVDLRLITSEEMAGPVQLAFQEGSGLEGRLTAEGPLVLEVNPANAREGRWEVTLTDGEGTVCTGALTVDP